MHWYDNERHRGSKTDVAWFALGSSVRTLGNFPTETGPRCPGRRDIQRNIQSLQRLCSLCACHWWAPLAAGHGAPTCNSRSPTAQSWPHLQTGSVPGNASPPVKSSATSAPARRGAWPRRDDPTQTGPFEMKTPSCGVRYRHNGGCIAHPNRAPTTPPPPPTSPNPAPPPPPPAPPPPPPPHRSFSRGAAWGVG